MVGTTKGFIRGKALSVEGHIHSGYTTAVGPISVSLTASGWTGSGPWTQTKTVSGITNSDNHLHVYPMDIADETSRKAYEKAYSCLAPVATTGTNTITFICRKEKPTTTFNVYVEGVR